MNLHDPYVYPDISLEEAIAGVDCLAILVDHKDYSTLDPMNLAAQMRSHRLFLAVNSKTFQPWIEAGYTVRQLGSGTSKLLPDYQTVRVTPNGASD